MMIDVRAVIPPASMHNVELQMGCQPQHRDDERLMAVEAWHVCSNSLQHAHEAKPVPTSEKHGTGAKVLHQFGHDDIDILCLALKHVEHCWHCRLPRRMRGHVVGTVEELSLHRELHELRESLTFV